MNVNYTAEELLAFEAEMANIFATGVIQAPVHLSGGNEEYLITIFKNMIEKDDWVLCSWRSHYHCLLKGVPRDELKQAILGGSSVSLCFPKQKILCSGIVGGTSPIAMGLAWAIKAKGAKHRVHCFVGDMSAESGIHHESSKYAARNRLPVHWIIEDNDLSVCSVTKETWGKNEREISDVTHYKYKLSRPHVGIGSWVRF